MKKTILILLSVLFSLSLSAQDDGGGHMAFNGVPMEGSIRSYADRLIQGGCRLVEDGEDSLVLSGNHLDWKNVTIIVQGAPSDKEVYGVTVYVEAGRSWSTIEERYRETAELYRRLYGRPEDHVEHFSGGDPGSDPKRLKALTAGKCNYMSLWNADGGSVIAAVHCDSSKYYIACTYQDDANAAKAMSAL